ncbi:unnamed protein product [Spirodela intermedia]|uniref:Uncharacterized protein n=1 Tax=Spirodela intermedia TaxID=51605 RepID=A0A7I8ISK3_SPIIN|nr:unnamed protein product [Spirodela intermedia]CAA6660135.1 unnamed protein product [Spirodela intermedia]
MESSSDCVPTEDAVQALIDFLVYPLLPAKCFFSPEPPSLDQQESVGKQLHAVVLLYNYYHRKQFPHLEFLDFKSFCKLASIAKPSLLTYMKCMQGPKELPSSIDQFSISEKMIWEACSICTGLEMLIDAQILRSWSISKVVVLLVDHTMMNCFLLYSSITQGVWSLIEKDADLPFGDSLNLAPIDVSSEKKKTATDHENDLLQFAFQAVKEKTGILKEELTILERRVAYSLSEEKTVAQLYLMQYNGTSTDKLTEFSIEDIVDSLQGPLFGKDLTPTLVVEYFHLLPYVGILAGWLSRQKSLDGLSSSLEKIRNSNGNLYLEAERPSSKKIDTSDICFSTVSEKALHKISGSGTNGISIMVENASSCDIRSSGTASRPHKEEENYPLACPQPKTLNESKTMENEIEIQRVEKRKNDSIASRSRENGGIFEDKEDFDGLCKKLCGKDPSSRNDALKNTVSRRSSEAAADLHTVALLSDPQTVIDLRLYWNRRKEIN